MSTVPNSTHGSPSQGCPKNEPRCDLADCLVAFFDFLARVGRNLLFAEYVPSHRLAASTVFPDLGG